MRHSALTIFSACLLWVTLAVGVTGCEENVNPFIETTRYFTAFGALDMNADSQFVRVSAIRQTIDFEESDPLNATLTSYDLTNGKVVEWTDSLFTFDDGSQGHVFYAPLRIEPEHTYRIEIVRDDGAMSVAETTVPSLPRAVVDPISFSGGNLFISQSVRWLGVEDEPFNVQTWYRFLRSQGSPFVDIPVDYPPANRADNLDQGWQFLVSQSLDKTVVLDSLAQPTDLIFMGMGMGITVLDEQFDPPGGVFYPEVLVQPGVFSNVVDGFGFIGAMGRFTVEWVLPDEAVRGLGYIPPRAQQ